MVMLGTADKTRQPDEKGQGTTPVPEARATRNEERTKTETPQTYTQEELDARLGKAGGKMKAQLELVSRERDDFRAKHESATKTQQDLNSQIEKANEEIKTLMDSFESLNSEDAVKVRQIIRDWEKRGSALEEREKALAPREERVNNSERVELIYTVADEYGLDDPDAKDKFKAAADRLNIKDREGLIILAETMNLEIREESAEESEKPKPKAPKPFSGKSEGGSPYFSRKQFDPNTKEGRAFFVAHKDEILKAEKEGRIRD